MNLFSGLFRVNILLALSIHILTVHSSVVANVIHALLHASAPTWNAYKPSATTSDPEPSISHVIVNASGVLPSRHYGITRSSFQIEAYDSGITISEPQQGSLAYDRAQRLHIGVVLDGEDA